ncbi:Multidrug resistance protein 3 [bioreactor metagenome]|uniref:Multidrug resistance protein 3 n=1 Tax=bioreactor metagenome TaxID=1076179 RepID=A0A645AVR6_9ZZZZ
MFAISVMQLILATALPHIVTQIGGDSLYSLVFSSYMLASIVTIPIFSKLADIYGKKKFYIIGMVTFALGTLLGGTAPSMIILIIARVIQGLGAGIITPVSLALISDMFTAEKRGRMIGVFGLVQLIANLLSPSLGKLITTKLNWHWLFFLTLIMVSLSALIVTVSSKTIRADSDAKLSEIDIVGSILFGGFCILIVSISKTIGKEFSFNVATAILLLVTIIIAVLLVINEKRHKEPIIKVEFFKVKIIRRSIISSIIAGAIMYGLITILPLCGVMLNKQGFKINESNILLFFMIGTTVGMLVSSIFTKKLNTVGFTKILWICMCIGSVLMLYFISRGNLNLFNLFNTFIGLSVGGVMSTFMINSQNAVKSEERTVLSGLVQLGRYLGASIGVTILTSMLPEVSLINSAAQFLGTFALLVVLSLVGSANEIF